MADQTHAARTRRLPQRPPRRHRPTPSSPLAEGSRRPYDRRSELPRVLPLWPQELDDESPEGRRRILARLQRALRAERRRGIAGHWTYDLARHVALLRVYRLERAAAGSMRHVKAVQIARADHQAQRHAHCDRQHDERQERA